MKCLLVKTGDKRKFLTSCKNLSSLGEFCRNLGADLLTVEVTGRHKLLTLEELAELICNPHHKPEKFDYKVLPADRSSRAAAITKRDMATAAARKALSTGKPVNVKSLSIRAGVSEQQARACIRAAAKMLKARIAMTAPGEYRRA